MCEKLRATRQCSSIKDIFAPIHSQALSAQVADFRIHFQNSHSFSTDYVFAMQ
jgi:hypothetical protein